MEKRQKGQRGRAVRLRRSNCLPTAFDRLVRPRPPCPPSTALFPLASFLLFLDPCGGRRSVGSLGHSEVECKSAPLPSPLRTTCRGSQPLARCRAARPYVPPPRGLRRFCTAPDSASQHRSTGSLVRAVPATVMRGTARQGGRRARLGRQFTDSAEPRVSLAPPRRATQTPIRCG